MSLVFPTPEPFAVPVVGSDALFPVSRIFCVGRNYAAHAAEMGNEVDREAPFYFTKTPVNALLTGATLPYPPGTEDFHYEMEMAVYLNGTEVFGYGCALDMTRRDLQIRERKKQRPWDLGKDFEGGAVMAPITPAAEVTDIHTHHIALTQNGTEKQSAPIADMVWSVPDLISHLSGFYTLRPGDVILTGTPAGVGPVTPGDVLYGTINGLAPVDLTITDPA